METGIALAFLSVLATTAIIGLAKSFPTQIYPNFFSGEVRREESTQDRWVAEKSKLRYKRKVMTFKRCTVLLTILSTIKYLLLVDNAVVAVNARSGIEDPGSGLKVFLTSFFLSVKFILKLACAAAGHVNYF